MSNNGLLKADDDDNDASVVQKHVQKGKQIGRSCRFLKSGSGEEC